MKVSNGIHGRYRGRQEGGSPYGRDKRGRSRRGVRLVTGGMLVVPVGVAPVSRQDGSIPSHCAVRHIFEYVT